MAGISQDLGSLHASQEACSEAAKSLETLAEQSSKVADSRSMRRKTISKWIYLVISQYRATHIGCFYIQNEEYVQHTEAK